MRDWSCTRVGFLAGTLAQGGAERQLYYLLRGLAQLGVRTRLLCLTRGEFWEEKIRALGVPVTHVGQRPSRVARLARILEELSSEPVDLIQSQHFFTNLYAVGASAVLGVRHVAAMRSDAFSEVRANGRFWGTLSLLAPHVIAGNSRAGIRNAESLGVAAERCRFLPNVVDTDVFRPAERPAERTVRLLAAGRLERSKRFDLFLELLAAVRGRLGGHVVGSIVGEGPHGAELRRRAAELGLTEFVDFPGEVPDMAPVYRSADVLVSTSEFEGTPNVVLEAMASGLPVLALRAGDIQDLVEDGETGFLAGPGEDEAFFDRLLALADDRMLRKRFGESGRRKAEEQRSLRRLPAYLSEFYEATLS